MAKKNKEVDLNEIEVNEAIEMPTETVHEPNVEFILDYFDIKAGTKKYLKTIPKILKDYVKFI